MGRLPVAAMWRGQRPVVQGLLLGGAYQGGLLKGGYLRSQLLIQEHALEGLGAEPLGGSYPSSSLTITSFTTTTHDKATLRHNTIPNYHHSSITTFRPIITTYLATQSPARQILLQFYYNNQFRTTWSCIVRPYHQG